MLTVERVSRILHKFNIAFTENAVLSFINRGLINKAALLKSNYYDRNTKYGYGIDQKSLEQFLFEKGVTKEDIRKELL